MLNMIACAEQTTKSVDLVPVEERNAPEEKAKVVSSQKSQTVVNDNKPAITALILDADKYSKQGQSEKAVATIERALRIEPRNALLWHQLAVIRMQQQQWQQAIVMARKSNALAGNNKELKSDNWALIAAAYDSLGNKEKASEARNRQSGQA